MPTNDPFASIAKPLAKSNDPFAAIAKPLGDTGDIDMSKVAGAGPLGVPALPDHSAVNMQGSTISKIRHADYNPTHYIPTANDVRNVINPIGDNIVDHTVSAITGPSKLVAPPEGTAETVLSGLGAGILPAYRMAVKPTIDAISESNQLRKAGGPNSTYQPLNQYDSDNNYVPTAGSKLIDSIPLAGPWARNLDDEVHKIGFLPAAAGLATDILAPEAVSKYAPLVPSRIKGLLSGNLDSPITPNGITPRERYDQAKSLGVSLNKADATNYLLYKGAKWVSEHSITGSGSYEALHNANIDALGNADRQFRNGIYSGTPVSGGQEIQNAANNYRGELNENAKNNFDYLTQETGNRPLDVRPISDIANNILETNKNYHEANPKLAPTNTLGIIQNIADYNKAPTVKGPLFPEAPKLRIVRDAEGKFSRLSAGNVANSEPVTLPFSDVQRLRSDLLEHAGSNDPELRGKTLPQSWLSNLSNAADQVMTDEKGLTPDQVEMLREGNTSWAEKKQKFDNPSSPFFNAVRTESPSNLYKNGIGHQTPEAALSMKQVLGADSPALNAVRRGAIESELKTNNDGSYNYKTFGGNFNRMDQGYRNELFTPEQLEKVKAIGDTGNVLYTDANPSGTAKLGQKVGEITSPIIGALGGVLSLNPAVVGSSIGIGAGYLGGQYALGKFMNHVPSTDWLMAPNKAPIKVNPFIPPAITGAAVTRKKQDNK